MGNTYSSSSYPISADGLRQEARALKTEAWEYSQKSRDAWQRGDKKQAAEYKAERLELEKRAALLNDKAADQIFRHTNAGRGKNEMDLHGLYVNEALEYVERRIEEARRKKRNHLVIITGRGNNSRGGIAKLKPSVMERLMQKHQLRCTMDRPNDGCIYVEFVYDGSFIGWVKHSIGKVCAIM